MKDHIIPARDDPPGDARLFEISFTCVIPPEIKIPEGVKDWVQMLFVLANYEGEDPLVHMSRLWELRAPIEQDVMDSMSKLN